MEQGVRLTGNLVGEEANALHVGMAVEVVFDDVTSQATLPRFKPVRRGNP